MLAPLVVGRELRRSLRLVILGVAFGMVWFSITNGPPLTGYARKLGAGDFLYGVLLALPVAGGVFQLFAAYWIERVRRRKALFLFCHLLARCLWLLIAFVPFFVPALQSVLRVWIVTALLSLASISGSVGSVCFLSWMGDLVPPEIRGRYFSQRNLVATITSFLGGLGAGLYLDVDGSFAGFAVVFAIAAIFGILDILCFIWVDEPPMAAGAGVLSFKSMVASPFRETRFRRYMVFWAAWLFAVNISGPFFNVYMLERLRFGYLRIALCTQMVSSLTTVLAVRAWGRLADAMGSKPVMTICCLGAAFTPWLWLLSKPGAPYLIPLVIGIHCAAGLFWSGLDVTYLNLLLGCSPERNRSGYMAGFTLFTSLIGSALAFLAGGYFLERTGRFLAAREWTLFAIPITGFHLLFALSGFLRLAATLFLLPLVREDGACGTKQVVKQLLKRGRTSLSSPLSEAADAGRGKALFLEPFPSPRRPRRRGESKG